MARTLHFSSAVAELVSTRCNCHFRRIQQLDEPLAAADSTVQMRETSRVSISAAEIQQRRSESITAGDEGRPSDFKRLHLIHLIPQLQFRALQSIVIPHHEWESKRAIIHSPYITQDLSLKRSDVVYGQGPQFPCYVRHSM
jgi:hypothetical protein